MASARLYRPLHISIFKLPPSIRLSIHQHSAISRSFSCTASRSEPSSSARVIADTVSTQALTLSTAVPSGLLDVLHATGLPWWAVIPASAVLVRGVFVYFYITKKSRRHAQIQRQLSPLVRARTLLLAETPEMKKHIMSWREDLRPALALWTKFRYVEQSAILLGKQFNAPRFYRNWRPYANFGVLIIMMEAIRIKCGTRVGLLSLVTSSLQWTTDMFKTGWTAAVVWCQTETSTLPSDPDTPPSHPIPDAEESISANADAIEHDSLDHDLGIDLHSISTSTQTNGFSADIIAAARESTSDPAVLAALAKLDGTPAAPHIAATYAEHMDPSMQAEGFLWVTDLTAVDPYHFFPALAALLLAAQIAIRPYQSPTQARTTPVETPPVTIPLDLAPGVQKWIRDLTADQQNALLSDIMSRPGARQMLAALSPQQQIGVVKQIHATSAPSAMSMPRAFKVSWRVILAVPIAGLFYAFVAVKLPTGLLLYLCTSMTIGWLQARWLDYSMPLPPNIEPCRRTVRKKRRKDIAHF